MSEKPSHAELASQLGRRVAESGAAERDARLAAFERGGGRESSYSGPVNELAAVIGSASYRVTDAQVAGVRELVGSDQRAFEVVMSASVGAGLARWDAATRAIGEASDEAS